MNEAKAKALELAVKYFDALPEEMKPYIIRDQKREE
jgi:hypothetical protein